MFPLLLSPLLTAVTSVASGAGSLAVGAVKTAAKAVSATGDAIDDDTVTDKSGKEWDRDSTQGKAVAAAQAKEEEAPKDLFGGLDLAKVKSAIEDRGEMGPEEEGPTTVYKQMISQLQTISSTLLRMEETLRMMLSIEYERIQGMIKQDRDTTLKVGDTDETTEKGRGILGRGKDMLGGAYGKAKDKLMGSTLFKLLGLGAIILAFKKYPDEIKAALEKVLKFFKSVFDYFTDPMFTWEKFKTDWVDIFFPKMKGILMGALDWLWSAIKNITAEFILGARGDKAIKQQTAKRERGVESLKEMTDLISKSGGATGTMSYVGGKVQFQKKGLEALGFTEFDIMGNVKGARKGEFQAFQNALTDAVDAMGRLSGESDGRIQFLGFPDMTDVVKVSAALRNGSIGINEILNAVPIIDGNIATMEDLKSFGLHRSAGTTKEMNQENVKQIHENLGEMTQLTKMMQSITGLVDADGNNIGEFKMNGEVYTMATARQRFKDLLAENEIFGQLSPSEILELSGNATSGIVSTDGTTAAQTDLKATDSGGPRDSFGKFDLSWGGKRKWDSGTSSWISINAPTTTTVMTKNEMANHLAAENPNWTQRLFAEKALLETT